MFTTRLTQFLLLLALAITPYSTILNAKADVTVKGTSFCEGAPEPGGEWCIFAWGFEDLPAKKVTIEQYDTTKERWEILPRYRNIDADQPVKSLELYRVKTCEKKQISVSRQGRQH